MKFNIPETLDGLSRDELLALIKEARSAVAEIGDNATDEEIQEATQVVDFLAVAQEKVKEIDQAEAARVAAIERVRAAAAEDADDSEEEDADEAGSEEDSDSEVQDQEPALVASGKPAVPAAKRAAGKSGAQAKKLSNGAGGVVIRASQGVRGYAVGSEFKSTAELAEALSNQAKALPTGRVGGKAGTIISNHLAAIDLSGARTNEFTQEALEAGKFNNAFDMFRQASNPDHYGGIDALVAAGGWVAAPEVSWNLYNDVSTEGLFSLPSVAAKRGGLQFTRGLNFAAVLADGDGDFHMTEAQVIAGATPKPTIMVPDVEFESITLDVTGVIIGSSLLTKAAYPELVEDFSVKVLAAHEMKKARRQYDVARTGSKPLNIAGSLTAADSISKLELLAIHIRNRNSWSSNVVLEVPLPNWYKAVIKADLALAEGRSMFAVSDQEVDAWFKARNLAPQWLRGIGQDLVETGTTSLTVKLPTVAKALMYRAGTWVKVTNDIIELGSVYDSVNLKDNVYTAMFTEEGIAVANMRHDSFVVDLPVAATGVTSAASRTAAIFEAAI